MTNANTEENEEIHIFVAAFSLSATFFMLLNYVNYYALTHTLNPCRDPNMSLTKLQSQISD